jgi:Zn-finger nucleic acid-binding protein
MAEMLRCPGCGGDVAATEHKCQYCDAQLLVKQCPSCLARVFHGHPHCPHCGASTEDVVIAADRAPRPCPRCGQTLTARLVGDLTLDDCPGCAGVFIDAAAIAKLLEDRAAARAEAVLGAYHGVPRVSDMTARGGKLYIKCPICGTVMNRKQFARGAGVVLDVCKGHGTWFDAGELPVVVDFVKNGGLGRAEKAELEDARQAALSAQRAALSARAAVPVTSHSAPNIERGAALIDLLFTLWR